MNINTEKISAKVIATIVATGLMSFCGVIVETAMNVTFPILMREFSRSQEHTSELQSHNTISNAVFCLK